MDQIHLTKNKMSKNKSNLEIVKEKALDIAKEKGFLSNNNLLELVDNFPLSEEDYDKLSDFLDKENINVKDDIIADNLKAGNNATSFYLSKIGQYKILTKEEEVALGKLMEEGKKAEAALLSDPNDDLKSIKKAGEEAREKLINCNLKLVVSIARHYMRKDVPFSDLIQYGNAGLISAVDKFDYKKGYKFSTYATWWIKQSIFRGISSIKNQIIVPRNKEQDLARLKRNIADLIGILGHEPTNEEICKKYPEWNDEKIKELESLANISVLSLNEKINDDDGDSEILDLKADKDSESDITKNIDFEDAVSAITKGMAKLNSQEKDIIIRSFGLNGDECESGESIAKDYHISRERIRQIKERALLKIKEAIVDEK